MTFITSYEGFF